MPEIKLFICCHQPVSAPEHPLLVPIQVGAALEGEPFAGFLHDNTGDNISHKNRSYCELTAQYWAWKNIITDYYGFFHYRRYLYPDRSAKHPYRIEGAPSPELLDKLGYDCFETLIPQYDMILPKGEDMLVPVREHYAAAPHHHRKDLALVEEIVQERHPEMGAAMERYLSGTVQYFGNIYVMRREIFQSYCRWLFPILGEFDRRADVSDYGPQERRVDGYLAERLLGVWVNHHRKELRVLELPRVHFVPDERERKQKQWLNALLPPGSRRRSWIKAAVKG